MSQSDTTVQLGDLNPTVTLGTIQTNVTIPGPIVINNAPGGAATTYIHQQSVAATEWIVNHNLGFRPNFEVTTDGGVNKWADGVHVSVNQLRVYWSEPMTGFVRCN